MWQEYESGIGRGALGARRRSRDQGCIGHGLARFNALDVLRDRTVTLHDSQTSIDDAARTMGSAHGVSENGALMVLTGTGMQLVSSSEVSVRPF